MYLLGSFFFLLADFFILGISILKQSKGECFFLILNSLETACPLWVDSGGYPRSSRRRTFHCIFSEALDPE